MICLNAAWAERFYFTCGICLGSMTLKQFVWILVWFVDMVKSSRLCLEDIYMWNPTTKHNSCVLRIPILCLNLSLKPFEHICFFWCQEPLENISHQMQWTHIVAQTSTFFFGKHMYFVYQWQSGYCRDTGTYIYTYLFIYIHANIHLIYIYIYMSFQINTCNLTALMWWIKPSTLLILSKCTHGRVSKPIVSWNLLRNLCLAKGRVCLVCWFLTTWTTNPTNEADCVQLVPNCIQSKIYTVKDKP